MATLIVEVGWVPTSAVMKDMWMRVIAPWATGAKNMGVVYREYVMLSSQNINPTSLYQADADIAYLYYSGRFEKRMHDWEERLLNRIRHEAAAAAAGASSGASQAPEPEPVVKKNKKPVTAAQASKLKEKEARDKRFREEYKDDGAA